jgi:hypothetical protein
VCTSSTIANVYSFPAAPKSRLVARFLRQSSMQYGRCVSRVPSTLSLTPTLSLTLLARNDSISESVWILLLSKVYLCSSRRTDYERKPTRSIRHSLSRSRGCCDSPCCMLFSNTIISKFKNLIDFMIIRITYVRTSHTLILNHSISEPVTARAGQQAQPGHLFSRPHGHGAGVTPISHLVLGYPWYF